MQLTNYPISNRRAVLPVLAQACFRTSTCWLMLSALMLSAGSGCAVVTAPVGALSGPTGFLQEQAAYNDTTDSMVLGWRNGVWAKKAWYQHEHLYSQHPHLRDLGKGFRAAYTDVANGGDGCPPVLPPREYWSWRYQSPEGQAKAAAWFEGYPLGAAAAEKDGIANWGEIQTSHTANSKSIRAREAYKRYYSQHRGLPTEEVPAGDSALQPNVMQPNVMQPEDLPPPIQSPVIPPANPTPADPSPAKPNAPELNPPKLDGNGAAHAPLKSSVVPVVSQTENLQAEKIAPTVQHANLTLPQLEESPANSARAASRFPVIKPAPQTEPKPESLPVVKRAPAVIPLPAVEVTSKVESLPPVAVTDVLVKTEVVADESEDAPPSPSAYALATPMKQVLQNHVALPVPASPPSIPAVPLWRQSDAELESSPLPPQQYAMQAAEVSIASERPNQARNQTHLADIPPVWDQEYRSKLTPEQSGVWPIPESSKQPYRQLEEAPLPDKDLLKPAIQPVADVKPPLPVNREIWMTEAKPNAAEVAAPVDAMIQPVMHQQIEGEFPVSANANTARRVPNASGNQWSPDKAPSGVWPVRRNEEEAIEAPLPSIGMR